MADVDIRLNKAAIRGLLDEQVTPLVLDRAAEIVLAGAKRRCPVDTTELVASIHVEHGRDGQGQYRDIGSDVDHALVVEVGGRPHDIKSHGDYPLRNRKTGQVFGREVHHPGTRAQAYLRPALDDLRLL
jgi:hypothetical protein